MRSKFVLLILIVICIFASFFTGCNIEQSQTQTQDETSSKRQEVPENTPPVCYISRTFESEIDFVEAIKDDSIEKSGDGFKLGGIEFYFVPEVIPVGAYLDHIAVKDFYITFQYRFDEEPDPYLERIFLFTWYRTMGTGTSVINVNQEFNEEQIEKQTEYHITERKPTGSYKCDKEYVCKDVYWEKDGFAFHSVVPVWFTNEDIEKYCVAKRVEVKKLTSPFDFISAARMYPALSSFLRQRSR